jgi:hypothetical protein
MEQTYYVTISLIRRRTFQVLVAADSPEMAKAFALINLKTEGVPLGESDSVEIPRIMGSDA